MFTKNQILLSSFDFDNALYFAAPVSVWQNGKILDYGGQIDKHTDEDVWINGNGYLKSTCEFRIR